MTGRQNTDLPLPTSARGEHRGGPGGRNGSSRMLRRIGAVAVAGVLMLGTAALSRVPWTPAGGDAGLLRLSWRMRGVSVERCGPERGADARERPVHMQGTGSCRQEGLPYRLRLEVDGTVLVDRIVEPSGIRDDRPMFVFHEERLAPGPHRVAVGFAPVEAQEISSDPEVVAFDGQIELPPRGVVLITLDSESGRLVPGAAGPGPSDDPTS